MLYLSIDQHRKQLTVNLRNESGDVLPKRARFSHSLNPNPLQTDEVLRNSQCLVACLVARRVYNPGCSDRGRE